jgi:hypothetical protein
MHDTLRAELEALYLDGLDKVEAAKAVMVEYNVVLIASSRPTQILTKQEDSDKRHEALYRDTSLLQAWSQLKAIVYAEIVERRQLLYAIQHSVVDPLVAFKVCIPDALAKMPWLICHVLQDQKERQRRRIKEETTATTNEHADYKVDSPLPRSAQTE